MKSTELKNKIDEALRINDEYDIADEPDLYEYEYYSGVFDIDGEKEVK